MPLYEYDCPNCGRFEEIRKSDDHVEHCPRCSEKVTHIISAPGGFKLVGKGFYNNDYKKTKNEIVPGNN